LQDQVIASYVIVAMIAHIGNFSNLWPRPVGLPPYLVNLPAFLVVKSVGLIPITGQIPTVQADTVENADTSGIPTALMRKSGVRAL
jgi:hypothetical protein